VSAAALRGCTRPLHAPRTRRTPPPSLATLAAGLGEARIRDLNDEINKSFREKSHWERQIKALGGPDYAATAPKVVDGDGREVPGSGGYRYFGAAKDLPGVRELFAVAAPK
jgi:pre-mRNA-splicing factor ISY1